ncbi:IST1 homolog isoform X2 [Phlebotomus argentipes]|uniref:IST1 homolog isoform X2 n=1 Tax=Phlebotomus argentipes TaxID=94469 RepID=UPI002892B561|nr:IST1 homolog isoform X2 [Phlebotomus argentipes]
MFSSGPNYTKLKTNLRLSLNRLKLLEKKKTELTQKARKEIADYIGGGKAERARIRVEHIIREDYLVEAMEIVEMYCDLVLARFGLVTQMKDLDEGIAEAVASLIWVAPRLQTDVQELKVIAEMFTAKYGKPYAEACRAAAPGHHVSEKLMHKLAIQAPPKLLVEKYLIEIAKNYNIEYEPDPQVMREAKEEGILIDLSDRNNLDGGVPMPPGFIDFPQAPPLPQMPQPPMRKPFEYPNMGPGPSGGASAPPFTYNIPPNPHGASGEKKDLNINTDFVDNERHSLPPPYSTISPDDNLQNSAKPKPQPRSKIPPDMGNGAGQPFPDLPNVPSDLPDVPPEDNDDIDFDDLSRRFEELKKKK